MADLEFAKVHSLTVYLADPLEAHSEFQFIVYILKRCCLFSALTTCPVIYQKLVKEFWSNAVVKKDNKGAKFLEAYVRGKRVLVTE